VRDEHGRFVAGATGNPRGRPAENNALKESCRQEGLATFRRIVQIRDDPNSDRQTVLAACRLLWERGFGKPTQSIELDGNLNVGAYSGAAITVTDAETATRIYREMIGDVNFDSSNITWAAREPPPARPELQHQWPALVSPRLPTEPVPSRRMTEVPYNSKPEPENAARAPALSAEEQRRVADAEADAVLRHLRPERIVT
jgi:hypothetical protein